jgi:hypothetical protein
MSVNIDGPDFGLREFHLRENAVDYWEGESPPG